MPIYYYQVGTVLSKAGNASLNISNPLATMCGKQKGLGKNLVLQNPHFYCTRLTISATSCASNSSGTWHKQATEIFRGTTWNNKKCGVDPHDILERLLFHSTVPVDGEALPPKICWRAGTLKRQRKSCACILPLSGRAPLKASIAFSKYLDKKMVFTK